MAINVLDSSIYNLIAAGEVVERPASVIKELVENSIDAGAKSIRVEILDGGIKQIKVTDDGCGIEKDDMVKAFLPHATSKIKQASDLENIFTLGFRGEALASIAAVSKVKLTSKVKTDELGNSIEIDAGKVLSQTPVGAQNGTTIIVSDLFYNVPARAKFLKKPASEEQEITNMIERFVLANPALKITYFANGKQILSSEGTTLKEAIYTVYGKQAITETLPVESKGSKITVSGYIGRPSFSKPNRTYQTIVVNGRYIQNQTIQTAVANAYGEMLMKRRYPFFVLNLQVDTSLVDVNVHPNKMEIRFGNDVPVYSTIYEAVSRALSEMDYVLQIDTQTGEVIKRGELDVAYMPAGVSNESEKPHSFQSVNFASKTGKIDKAGVNLNKFANIENVTDKQEKEQLIQDILDSNNFLSDKTSVVADGFGLGSKLIEKLANDSKSVENERKEYLQQTALTAEEDIDLKIKIVGKLFKTYILVEYGDNLYVIDQHAAHERILYEKFTREYNSHTLSIQPLMFPYILTVGSSEWSMLKECIGQLKELGFDVDEFGDRTIKVSAVPMLLANINFEEFFANFLSETKANTTILKQSDIIKEKLMQHSCKSAIKAGKDLSENEIKQLFSQMKDEKIPLFCPHGRPIAVRVTKTEIEKWFKRIV